MSEKVVAMRVSGADCPQPPPSLKVQEGGEGSAGALQGNGLMFFKRGRISGEPLANSSSSLNCTRAVLLKDRLS